MCTELMVQHSINVVTVSNNGKNYAMSIRKKEVIFTNLNESMRLVVLSIKKTGKMLFSAMNDFKYRDRRVNFFTDLNTCSYVCCFVHRIFILHAACIIIIEVCYHNDIIMTNTQSARKGST